MGPPRGAVPHEATKYSCQRIIERGICERSGPRVLLQPRVDVRLVDVVQRIPEAEGAEIQDRHVDEVAAGWKDGELAGSVGEQLLMLLTVLMVSLTGTVDAPIGGRSAV
jgi:hypothetical protein